MRTSLNINIPEPCHEDWNKMTLQQKGRYCKSCEKTVFDFTTKTDEQIVKTFLDEGKVCGRFKSTQLNRALVLNRKEKNNYLSYVASTLFAFLSFGTQDVEAQIKPKIVNLDSLQKQMVNGKMGTSILKARIINGFIASKTDGLPLPGVRILNLRSNVETQTDFDGNFSIKVFKGDKLRFEFVGMKSMKLKISEEKIYNIKMTEDLSKLETIVISGYPSYISNKYYQKKINKSNRLRARKEKLQKIKKGELERTQIGNFLYNITNVFRRKE